LKTLLSILIILFSSTHLIFSDDLVGIKEITIEEEITSAEGTHKSRFQLKEGKTYTNETEKPAKFFVSDKVGGALSKGSKLKLFTKNDQKKTKVTLNLLKGTAHFRVKKLKRQEFKVKTPSAVAGVRGTIFTIHLNDDKEEVKLPEGELSIKDNTGQEEILKDGNKISIKNNIVAKPIKMDKVEIDNQKKLIITATNFRNFKIEKAIEKYEKEKKYFNEKKDTLKSKESLKINKELDKELKKAKKKGDLKQIDSLNKLRTDHNLNSDNFPGVKKLIDGKNKKLTITVSKYQPKVDKVKVSLLKTFDSEIKKYLKIEPDIANDLKSWKQKFLSNFLIDLRPSKINANESKDYFGCYTGANYKENRLLGKSSFLEPKIQLSKYKNMIFLHGGSVTYSFENNIKLFSAFICQPNSKEKANGEVMVLAGDKVIYKNTIKAGEEPIKIEVKCNTKSLTLKTESMSGGWFTWLEPAVSL
jgi:hypothetical protein